MHATMSTKNKILSQAAKAGVITSTAVVKRFSISRQAAAKHLRTLVAQKKLAKLGSTRSARYVLYDVRHVRVKEKEKKFSSKYHLQNLDEASVFRELELKMGLIKMLSSQAHHIVAYAFTEMFNNAIDHSQSRFAVATCENVNEYFRFEIRDYGIGAFESVRRKFRLRNHFEAAEHLLKGKQSVDPAHHSGQGIFFTSKIADEFNLESAQLRLVVDNRIKDVFLRDVPKLKGTRVVFSLKKRSRKDLKALFDEYTDRDYEFDKTKMTIHLSEKSGEYISRSQARRILYGLEKFRRIVLDFKRVKGIGQGFADEIFRVFQNSHPDIKIENIHASPSVIFMIRRALRNMN